VEEEEDDDDDGRCIGLAVVVLGLEMDCNTLPQQHHRTLHLLKLRQHMLCNNVYRCFAECLRNRRLAIMATSA
jgi:hypothetical protein